MVSHMATRIRKTPEQRVAALEKDLALARKTAQERQRAVDVRRKVILGGALQEQAKRGSPPAVQVLERIMRGLRRPHDRAAFGLAPLTVEELADLDRREAARQAAAESPERAYPPPGR